MRINVADISDAGLAELIAQASAELHKRLVERGPDIIRKPAPQKTVVIDEPPDDEKDFVLMIKKYLQDGKYIKAAERRQVAEIAGRYPAWAKLQKIPADSGTGAWREAKGVHSAGRARER